MSILLFTFIQFMCQALSQVLKIQLWTKQKRKYVFQCSHFVYSKAFVQLPSSGSHHFSNRSMLLLLSHFSRVWLCATPETAAHQAPPSMGFSRQEYWSGVPLPSPIYRNSQIQSGQMHTDKKHTSGLEKMGELGGDRWWLQVFIHSDGMFRN